MVVVPFFSADKAWLWAVSVRDFKANPAGPEPKWPKVERPCSYQDVLTAVARLGLTAMEHRRLVQLARAGWPPRKGDPEADHRLWAEVMDRLHTKLTAKGIVIPAVDWAAGAAEGNG